MMKRLSIKTCTDFYSNQDEVTEAEFTISSKRERKKKHIGKITETTILKTLDTRQ